MKSISFLRNTWKKWELKTSDARGQTENINPQEPQALRSSPASGRSLTITVKHAPLEVSNATPVEGSWKPEDCHQPPPSPVYDQFAQHRPDFPVIRKNGSQVSLNITQHTQSDSVSKPKLDASTPPRSLRHTSAQVSPRTNQSPRTNVFFNDKDIRPPSSPGQTTTSLQSPILPTYGLLPPIDLNYGPGSKFEKKLESTSCRCVRSSPHFEHQPQCPRYTFLEAQSRKHSRAVSDNGASQKTVHAVLDLSVDSNPQSLYRNTGSTPHLPYKDRNSRPAPSDHSSCSDASDTEQFPLSLFPAPPPLIVRKKIPAPLVLRPRQPSSSQSSVDSTPIGTPTTPRFQSTHTPPPSSVASPSKKYFLLRQCASFTPPPCSPPNSPLPSLPVTPDASRRPSEHRRSPDHSDRPLRGAQSTANLRNVLPFPATHRLTSSEPISDQSSSPIKRDLVKPRPDTIRGIKDLQAYMELAEPPAVSSTSSTDGHVQWGYAL